MTATLSAIRQSAATRARQWARRRQGEDPNPVVLSRRRIYILPTRQGLVFGVLLFAMLLGSMNYSSSIGFLLTFMLASLGFVAMHHTHRNLERLQVTALAAEPVFAGGEAHFRFNVRNHSSVPRGGIAIDDGRRTHDLVDVPAEGTARLTMTVPAERRGWLRPRRVGLHTTYPFGLFRAWVWLHLDIACLVYPAPAGEHSAPIPSAIESGSDRSEAIGREDFSGLRDYRAGDAPRHVAWRASARRDGDLVVKEFHGGGAATRMLRWQDAGGHDAEARLSQLARWVIEAHAHDERWGMELPTISLPVDSGEKHYRRSLRALALFGLPEGGEQ